MKVTPLLAVSFVLFFSPLPAQEKDKPDPQILEQWKNTMTYGISSQRISTIQAITRSKTTEAYYLIEEALVNDFNSGVRGQAAYDMITLKIEKSGVWMQSLKNEKDTEVLRRVVFAVSELNIPGVGSQLYMIMTNYLDQPKENYLTAATIRALGQVKYAPASKQIFELLTNFAMSPEIRSASAVAIGDLGGSAELDQIMYIVENPGEDKAVRMYSAYSLGKSGDKRFIDPLFDLIANEKEDLNVRLWAIAGLEFIKDPGVENRLIELCKVDHKSVRMKAIETLGNMKSEKAKTILIFKAEYDPEWEVKKKAKKALKNIGIDLDELEKNKKENESKEKEPPK